MLLNVILSSYNYQKGTVTAEDLTGDLLVSATPIGNRIPHPQHSVGFIEPVECVECSEMKSYIFIPSAERDNWEPADFFAELCTVAEGIIYDTLGNPLGDAVPGCCYLYAPTLKTLFILDAE